MKCIYFGTFDHHALTHFMGCGWITALWIAALGWRWETILMGFACGLLWEVFDYLNCKLGLEIPWLDPRGFDPCDLIYDAAGVVTSCLLILTLQAVL